MSRLVTSFNIETDLYKKCNKLRLTKGVSKSELMNIALKRLFNSESNKSLLKLVKTKTRTARIKELKSAIKRLESK